MDRVREDGRDTHLATTSKQDSAFFFMDAMSPRISGINDSSWSLFATTHETEIPCRLSVVDPASSVILLLSSIVPIFLIGVSTTCEAFNYAHAVETKSVET